MRIEQGQDNASLTPRLTKTKAVKGIVKKREGEKHENSSIVN